MTDKAKQLVALVQQKQQMEGACMDAHHNLAPLQNDPTYQEILRQIAELERQFYAR